MSMNESRSIHAAEDWGVVLQSVPSRNKREIVKRLEEVFELDKRDAEQVLSNMPLILIDNLSFGLAARIKNFFQKIGAVAETTNHDMIKKNCFQVLWPQTPDLSFFMKNAVSARLFSAAIDCITLSSSQYSSGQTAAGFPPNNLSLNASTW